DAAFVGPTAVVDDEDVARVRRLHWFERNMHTAEMLCRKSAASRSIVSIDRMNTERRDANRSAKAQRRIRNQRRRKLGKLFGEQAVVQCCDSFIKFDNWSFQSAAMVWLPWPRVLSLNGMTIARPWGTRLISRSRIPSSGGLIRLSAELIASSGARIFSRFGPGSSRMPSSA